MALSEHLRVVLHEDCWLLVKKWYTVHTNFLHRDRSHDRRHAVNMYIDAPSHDRIYQSVHSLPFVSFAYSRMVFHFQSPSPGFTSSF
jgi:hypothetical protein